MLMAARTAEREQFLADIITGAVEGGTGYWATVTSYRWQNRAAQDVYAIMIENDCVDDVQEFIALANEARGRKIKLSELLDECDDVRKLDIDAVARGLGKVKSGEVGVRGDILDAIKRGDAENDAGNIDADGADVIAQAALLGEVRYG